MFKLKVLPQPDFFLRLLPGFAQAQVLEQFINRIFAGQALAQLQPLAGKRLLFATPGGELELVMQISDDLIRISDSMTDAPDVTIRGDLTALTALCLGLEDSDSLFFSRRLLMTGDTAVGLMFKNILTNLDFDLSAELEKRLGRQTADALWKTGRQAIRAVEFVDQRLVRASIAIGERIGLSPTEKVKALEAELHHVNEEFSAFKRRSERRLRPAPKRAA
jgi:predicted lipid carrier protein YhbT